MKLIIDAPEDIFNSKECFDAIKYGIPLDDIRAEIASYKSDRLIDVERNEMIHIVLEIIDKHMRGDADEHI